ncbi:MAG: 4-alpha-glucanotransferase, partial [Acidobacteriales bacterium]|nr:4-alpha-glucanotransferase [Terriglobales bacterium]
MEWQRASGVLLHITSLASKFAVGDLGPEARRFAHWLAEGGQKIWQVLPLAPTGYGDSPYQALSAFAGNTLLISIEDLAEEGLLAREDYEVTTPRSCVDFASAKRKQEVFRRAFANFEARHKLRESFEQYGEKNRWWLDDYALFRALKEQHGGRSWIEWEPALKRRETAAVESARRELTTEIQLEKFLQWIFHRQWCALHDECHANGVQLMGDLPIYVAHDSADVWAHPELFDLDEQGRGKFVAGVPPDYFSATGQLWGNPIYAWAEHEKTGFAWWVARLRAMLTQFDLLRIDHFRGFEAYWAVPGGDATAERGQWVKAPGERLFNALQAALGKLPVLAENLGVITPEVEALRTEFCLPGMAILQFAFGSDPQAPYFTPHNYTRDRVAYTGTHDNDTVMGWWTRTEATATETVADIRRQRDRAAKYLDIREGDSPNWAFIRGVMASVADAAIFPMQDVLGLGTESRMNYPGTSSGNWLWRMLPEQMRSGDAKRLQELA